MYSQEKDDRLSTNWKTIVIEWDFRTKIFILVYDLQGKITNYTETKNNDYFLSDKKLDTGEPGYNFYARSFGKMLAKFHKCKIDFFYFI